MVDCGVSVAASVLLKAGATEVGTSVAFACSAATAETRSAAVIVAVALGLADTPTAVPVASDAVALGSEVLPDVTSRPALLLTVVVARIAVAVLLLAAALTVTAR